MKSDRNRKTLPEWVGNLLAVCLLCVVAALLLLSKPLSETAGTPVLERAFGLRYFPSQPEEIAQAAPQGDESAVAARSTTGSQE